MELQDITKEGERNEYEGASVPVVEVKIEGTRHFIKSGTLDNKSTKHKLIYVELKMFHALYWSVFLWHISKTFNEILKKIASIKWFYFYFSLQCI